MDELNPDQLQQLQAQLLRLRDELQQLLIDSRSSSAAVDLEQPIGRLSRVQALQQQSMAKANRAATERRLQLIESALQGFRQQHYGQCRRCEEPIGYLRLQARPESPFCRDCQGQIEVGR